MKRTIVFIVFLLTGCRESGLKLGWPSFLESPENRAEVAVVSEEKVLDVLSAPALPQTREESPSAPPPASVLAVVELTNIFRKRNGLAVVRLNQKLSLSAQAYAERMATENYFDHVSRQGDTPKMRCEDAGYAGTHLGENIARGYITPRETVLRWIESPSHRQNLMIEDARDVGIGHAIGRCDENENCHYWVQEFGHFAKSVCCY